MIFHLFIGYSANMNTFPMLLNVDRSLKFCNGHMLLDGFA